MNTITEAIMAFIILAISLYLLFYFISLYAKIYQLVKLNIGSGTAIIFAISILWLGCGHNRQNQSADNNKYTNVAFKAPTKNNTYQNVIVRRLENNSLYALTLYIQYAQPYHTKKMIPVSATCSFTGTSFNNQWHTNMVDINTSEDSTQIFYSVNGSMDWSLLGFPIFQSMKNFDGMIEAGSISDELTSHRSSLLLWAIVVLGCAGFGWYHLRRYLKNRNKE